MKANTRIAGHLDNSVPELSHFVMTLNKDDEGLLRGIEESTRGLSGVVGQEKGDTIVLFSANHNDSRMKVSYELTRRGDLYLVEVTHNPNLTPELVGLADLTIPSVAEPSILYIGAQDFNPVDIKDLVMSRMMEGHALMPYRGTAIVHEF